MDFFFFRHQKHVLLWHHYTSMKYSAATRSSSHSGVTAVKFQKHQWPSDQGKEMLGLESDKKNVRHTFVVFFSVQDLELVIRIKVKTLYLIPRGTIINVQCSRNWQRGYLLSCHQSQLKSSVMIYIGVEYLTKGLSMVASNRRKPSAPPPSPLAFDKKTPITMQTSQTSDWSKILYFMSEIIYFM